MKEFLRVSTKNFIWKEIFHVKRPFAAEHLLTAKNFSAFILTKKITAGGEDTGAHGRAPAGNENRMFSLPVKRPFFLQLFLWAQQRKS